ncbi:hypothetical protein BGZ96_009491 [Linnemannia gamsii]|uniref:Uncharacterized protein n=1 Tax=Linnemannia gamsii TaxID=64522 RepID=A0ABQ7JWM2_9FUNG|nr:hypothetical protein BGZ96_009491 [Linnemannia gamsii]
MSTTILSSQDFNIIFKAIQEVSDSTGDQYDTYQTFKARTGTSQDPWFERHFAVLATDSERHRLEDIRVHILTNMFTVQNYLVAFSKIQPSQARMIRRFLELDYGQQKIHLEREHRGYVLMSTNKTETHELWQKRAWELQEYIYNQRVELSNLCLQT